MLSAVRLSGQFACVLVEGAIDSLGFRVYTEKVLGPELRPGDVVIMDNLSSHKDSEALDHIRSTGAAPIFLPPYSPDLNPIELRLDRKSVV